MKFTDIGIDADGKLYVTDEFGVQHGVELTNVIIDDVQLLGIRMNKAPAPNTTQWQYTCAAALQ